MAGSNILCEHCREPFLSRQILEKIRSRAYEKGIERLIALFTLCPACRRQVFTNKLINDRLEKVEPVKHAARRRRETVAPVKHDPRVGSTVFKSECFNCNQGCDARVHVKEGKVVLVEGDVSSPVTKGTLCAKGLASKEILYHPDRLLYPLLRIGERGEGKWQRISWDEALDSIAGRLKETEKQYGSESIVLTTGTNRGWIQYFRRFANVYGKQWMGPGIAQCLYPRITGQTLVLGGSALENPYYAGTQCMLIWGCNPTNTWPVKGLGMMEARSQGAKMIVVDPVLSEAASKADLWLQLRPGTDTALILGMMQVIISEGLYDKPFVDEWCFGFEELRERAGEFPPERAEEITWVPAKLIREAARLFSSIKPASITECLSIDQNADTISTSRSLSMLAAITGNIDIPGGNVFSMPKSLPNQRTDQYVTKEQHERRLGSREYPFLAGEACVRSPSAHNHTVWQAILTGKPYPVRAIYCQGSNMLLSYANTRMVTEALMKLDFLAVADLFMTDTARIADIVLPCGSWLERSAVTQNDQTSFNSFHLEQKIVQIGECRSDYTVLNDLGTKLGLGDCMFPSDEAYCDFQLAPSGMTWEEFKKGGIISFPDVFRKYAAKGFNTPSRKVQLYDPRLEELGFDPLPAYREPTESPFSDPDLAEQYPLIITTGGRVPVFRHSELRNIPLLKEIVPEALVSINPRTAGDLGIQNGDLVVVESPRGAMEARAYLTEGIDPRVVQVPSHWPGISNVNRLTDNKSCAPMIGSAQLRCQLCRVIKRGDDGHAR